MTYPSGRTRHESRKYVFYGTHDQQITHEINGSGLRMTNTDLIVERPQLMNKRRSLNPRKRLQKLESVKVPLSAFSRKHVTPLQVANDPDRRVQFYHPLLN